MNQFLAAVCGVLVVGGIALTVAGMHRAPASEATFSTGCLLYTSRPCLGRGQRDWINDSRVRYPT